jgi:hypothetical protein
MSAEDVINQCVSIAESSVQNIMEKLKNILSSFSSYSQVMKVLTALQPSKKMTVIMDIELTEHALNILKANYTGRNNSAWDLFLIWTLNRIQILKAAELLITEQKQYLFEHGKDFVQQREQLRQEWMVATEEKFHPYIRYLTPQAINTMENVDINVLLNCFNLQEQVIIKEKDAESQSSYFIPLKPLKKQEKKYLCLMLFNHIQISFDTMRHILAMFHITPTDLQTLLIFWFIECIEPEEVLSIVPSRIQMLMNIIYPVSKSVLKWKDTNKLQSSPTMLSFYHILSHAKKTNKTLNSILFISIYRQEATEKLETRNSILHKNIDAILVKLNDILFLKTALKNPKIQSTHLSIEVFEKCEVTFLQIIAREQLYQDMVTGNLPQKLPHTSVDNALNKLWANNQVQYESRSWPSARWPAWPCSQRLSCSASTCGGVRARSGTTLASLG